jgi:hypothetical protein
VIILILPKDDKPESFECQVCHAKYKSSLEALNCPEIHGYPKDKFKRGEIIICSGKTNQGFVGEITNIAYSKPGHMTKLPHTPLFTIKVIKFVGEHSEKESNLPLPKFTTAHEDEIEIYQET